MVVRPGGYLGQVGDAKHLSAPCQRAKHLPHYLGVTAADAHVHLVENYHRHSGAADVDHLNGKTDSGKLSPGRRLRHRVHRQAGIRRHVELHAIRAAPGGRAGFVRRYLNLEPRAPHPQPTQILDHLQRETIGGPCATF